MKRLWLLSVLILLGPAETGNAQSAAPEARAMLEAESEATLSADVPALVTHVNVDIGERFEKAKKLVEFDCGLREARVTAALGVHEGAVARLASKQRLQRTGTIGPLEAELARAEVKKAEGELAEMRDSARRCVVLAPFSGRVAQRHANAYEVVGPDRPLLTIVSDGPLRIKTLVPSTWLRWLAVGKPFEVAVDETGKTYPAEVTAISGKVDAQSQSIELLGRLTAPGKELLPGMSGFARFSAPSP